MPLFLELIDLQTFLPKVRILRTKVLKVDNRNVRVVLTTLKKYTVLYSFRYG